MQEQLSQTYPRDRRMCSNLKVFLGLLPVLDQILLQVVAKGLRHCIENSVLLPKTHLPLHKKSLNALPPFSMLILFSLIGKCRGNTLLGGKGARDGSTWMTRIVRFITVSVSTLFAIACSIDHPAIGVTRERSVPLLKKVHHDRFISSVQLTIYCYLR